MTLHKSITTAGTTLVEMMIGLGVLLIVGALAYSMLTASTTLMAKNLSLNGSNTSTRGSLDRIFSDLYQANRQPVLINADATGSTAADQTAPAAGVKFDCYLGGPYIVGNPGSGLAATATSFNLYYSADPMANPPVPVKNDVVIMDGQTRALVNSCTVPTSSLSGPTPSPTPTSGRMVTVTLQQALGNYTNPTMTSGTAIPWISSTQQTAYLVHSKAFIVWPMKDINNNVVSAELREYPDAEATSDYTDPTKYIVLIRNIGVKTAAEYTPFSLPKQQGVSFLNIAIRIEDTQYNKRLSTQQANDYNTFLGVDSTMRPRNILINP